MFKLNCDKGAISNLECMYREVVNGDPRTNNACESGLSASKLGTIKMEKFLAQYKIIANVQESEYESHINIVSAYHNY